MTRRERKSKEMKECSGGIWFCTILLTLFGFSILAGAREAGWFPAWFNVSFFFAANIAVFFTSFWMMVFWAEKSVTKHLDREDAENGQPSP